MTTIQITLPDQLAKEAEEAGLLSPEFLEQVLREKLQAQNQAQSLDQLLAAMDRISAVNDLPYMSPEEIADEIALMRVENVP